MVAESLLTNEVRALIGQATAPVPVRLTSRMVERTMDVYLGGRPRRFAPGEAVPGFVLVALEAEAEPLDVPQLLPDGLMISNEMTFERPLCLGEELTVQWRVGEIRERFGGQFGYSVFVPTEVLVRDVTGAVVARTSRTMMYYDASDVPGEGGER
ncbi:MAG: MaoC family dehydratase N-terminal domain-containing protein [Dehalococcoidia bacterium]|nr:MaoC family dehydratase N-terminal domain-containing protein [Dehalococcoidia bacterium]